MPHPGHMYISKLVAATLIHKGYEKRKHEGIEKLPTDHWVIDQRSGQVQGPFDTGENAIANAAALNDFVLRNADISTKPFLAFTCEGDLAVPKS